MLKLNLKKDYQKKYLEAINKNYPTLTAAPFFSLKTETIKQALSSAGNVLIFDLRSGISSLNLTPKIQHIFLDSVEIVKLEDLKSLLSSLQHQGKTVHLITHLYHYEKVKDLIPKARRIFPQLLKKGDIREIKALFTDFPESERKFVYRFIDYFEGWPAVVHTFNTPEKFKIMEKFAYALNQAKERINMLEYFQKIIKKYLKIYFDTLSKVKAVDKNLTGKHFSVPQRAWLEYNSDKIDIKGLVEKINHSLWHFTKYGYLWLDEETATLRVPSPLSDIA